MDNRERARARDKKQGRRISLEGKHESFYIVAARNASGHQDENERHLKIKKRTGTHGTFPP